MCNILSKVCILKISLKRFGYPDPYPVSVWKQFLDIRIRLQTYYPAGYPTGKPDSDHLCWVGVPSRDEQGCQIFFATYGQNPNKKWPKWLSFFKVMAKITKCFNYDNFFKGVSNCSESSIFFAEKKCGFAKEASFSLKQQFLPYT